MQKIYADRKYISLNGDGACFVGYYIDYYILKSELTVPNANFSATIYGIEIEKKYEEGGVEKTLERASVSDIYTSLGKTKSLIKKLSDRLVSPVMLEYVIDDILSENGAEPPKVTLNVG